LDDRVADVADANRLLDQLPDHRSDGVETVVGAVAELEDDGLALDRARYLVRAGAHNTVACDLGRAHDATSPSTKAPRSSSDSGSAARRSRRTGTVSAIALKRRRRSAGGGACGGRGAPGWRSAPV